MSEFKIGDRVKVSEQSNEVRTIKSISGNRHYPYVLDEPIDNRVNAYNSRELKLATRDWDHLAEGDILLDKNGDEREILAVVGKIIFVADDDGTRGLCDTAPYLQRRGYTIKQDSPADDTTELSVADIETKLGLPAGTLRVKKD